MHFPQATHLEIISVTEGTKRLNWIAFSGQCCEQTEQYPHFEISTTGRGQIFLQLRIQYLSPLKTDPVFQYQNQPVEPGHTRSKQQI